MHLDRKGHLVNIRRAFSTTAAAAAIVLGVTACGGASDTSKNWFSAWCEGLQSLQTSTTGGDLASMQTQFADLATNLRSLPAPDIEGGQAFADAQIAAFEAAANPEAADMNAIASLGDMSQFTNNDELREAAEAAPGCAALVNA